MLIWLIVGWLLPCVIAGRFKKLEPPMRMRPSYIPADARSNSLKQETMCVSVCVVFAHADAEHTHTHSLWHCADRGSERVLLQIPQTETRAYTYGTARVYA